MRCAFFISRAHATALAALIALLLWEWLELDLPMVQMLIENGRFPLKHHVVLEQWLHDGIKPLMWGIFALLCAQWVRPWGLFADVPRGRLAFAVLSLLLCLITVAWIKRHSQVSCPWELREVGGLATYLNHGWPWSHGHQADGGSGQCFPGGHANTGFAWLGLYVALQGFDARRARWALLWALGWGVLLGTVQQLRGAHYFSHAPWTALICWYLCSLLWWLWPQKYKIAPPKTV
jgi:membrane-associated PAP2 superfamily phosphatase